MQNSQVIHHYNDTYSDKLKGYEFIYNPVSLAGLAVLNKPAAYLFNLVDNKRTVEDIYHIAKKKDKNTKLSEIKQIFKDFEASQIIYQDKPTTLKDSLPKRPKNLGIWLHITNQCNMRCKYCYIWKTPDVMLEETAMKALEKALTDAKKNLFEEVSIKFSGGECLLELPKILRLIKVGNDLAHKIGIKIGYVILTNGVLITDKTAQLLKEYNIGAGVSLDGLSEYNDVQRTFSDGSGTFKYVEKGIDNLMKYKVPFNILVVITSKNVMHLEDLTRYFLTRKINFVFSFFRENSYAATGLTASHEDLIINLRKSYKLMMKSPPPFSVMGNMLDKINFKKPHLSTCDIGSSYMIIRQDGKIASCQMTMNRTIGSIDDEDIIKTMRDGSFLKPDKVNVEHKANCKTCHWKYVCCGGCPVLTHVKKGTYTTNSPYCEVYRALIPDVLKIEAMRIIKYVLTKKTALTAQN